MNCAARPRPQTVASGPRGDLGFCASAGPWGVPGRGRWGEVGGGGGGAKPGVERTNAGK